MDTTTRNILIGLGVVAAGGAAWWWWNREDDEAEDVELDMSSAPSTFQQPGAHLAARRAAIREAFSAGGYPWPRPPAPAPMTATPELAPELAPAPAPTVSTIPTMTATPMMAPNGPTGSEPSYLTQADMLAPENISAPKVVRLAGFN